MCTTCKSNYHHHQSQDHSVHTVLQHQSSTNITERLHNDDGNAKGYGNNALIVLISDESGTLQLTPIEIWRKLI